MQLFALGLVFAPLALAQSPAPSSTPDPVPARGEQDVVFRAPASGMYRVRVKSDAGTACTLTDHLRGPFVSDGVVGDRSCSLDVLLDAGLYKARLTSPEKGKGMARLEARPFVDAGPAVRLDDGVSFDRQLHAGEQVTSWLRVDKKSSVTVEIAGRTAGSVALWKDGAWLEQIPVDHAEPKPRADRPIHRWRLDAVLDPGDYKLVVYGTQPKTWTQGPDDDVVFITRGAPPGGASRTRTFTIPAWGFTQLAVPSAGLAVFAQVDKTPERAVTVTAEAVIMDKELGPVRSKDLRSCSVGGATPMFACSVVSGTSATEGSHIIMIDGPPGTTGTVTWGPLGSADVEGFWPSEATREITIGAAGSYFVAATPLPLSQDAEPLGCAIDQVAANGTFARRVAFDAPSVSWSTPFERRFNANGSSKAVWVNIEKPGLYSVSGNEDLGASCEVFRLTDNQRVGVGKDDTCSTTMALSAGPYEVRFYGGRPGIQTLRIAQVGLGKLASSTPARASCVFENLSLAPGRYRLVTSSEGGAVMRSFFARGTPTSLSSSLPLVVDPDRALRVPVASGAGVLVRARPGTKIACALDGVDVPVSGGACATPALAKAGTLTVTSREPAPVYVVLSRVEPVVASPAPPKADIAPPRAPVLTADKPLWFSLERNRSVSMVVSVEKPGLYDVTTEGLLSTTCRLRTPTVGNLVEAASNGRGRNCQVQAYLKPGTYLFTATTTGNSRGRTGVRLAERPPRDLGTLGVGDEIFFRVPAGELVQQTFDVKKGGNVVLQTSAQGASPSCRFDDHDGWPLMAVPSPCSISKSLDAGRYILSTLPLTVETRRRSSLVRPADAVVLQGDKTHALALNRAYQAQLGTDGKDSFSFRLAADLDVGVVLDHGMQGRIYRVDGKAREVVDTVAPEGGGGLALSSSDESGEGYEAGEGGEGGEGYEGSECPEGECGEGYDEGGEYGEYGEYEGGEGYEGESDYEVRMREQREAERRAAAAAEMARVTTPVEVGALAGHKVSLKAGSYVLETEHSRGDVAIGYRVMITARALAPDVSITAPVPGRVDVVMPRIDDARSGLLRIKTHGDADVRCRLRDARGVLVAESAESGADWNCALAVPLAEGRYSLTIETETLQPGTTELSASLLEAKDTGELKDGDTFKVVAKVASAPLPSAGADVVQDVVMTSEQDFSCAVQDDKGAMLDRQVSVRSCRFLLWPGTEKKGFRVFAWTADRPATVKVAYQQRPVKGFGGGGLGADVAGRARIDVRGRYTTGPSAMCRAVSLGGGPLTSCAGAASFIAGDVIVANTTDARIELDEAVAQIGALDDEVRRLDGTPAPQRQRSKGKALHLVAVEAPFGSSSSPSCAVEGGVSSHESATCFAATGPVEESTLLTWTRPGAVLSAHLRRRAAPWPSSNGVLAPGTSSLSWTDDAARWSLPVEGFRLSLSLPTDAWAILVDDGGRARDLCTPRRGPVAEGKGALSTCVLRGRGGELVIVASSKHDARADLLELSTAEAPRALVGLRETKPAAPGRERLLVAAAPTDRVIRVEGRGVLACAIHLENGGHVAGCRAQLPAGQGAEIRVEHDDRPWRVFAADPNDVMSARYGALPSGTASPAAFGTAVALAGNVVQRGIELKEPAAVRVRATSGVCAIATNGRIVEAQGLGAGCDIVRVLPAGSHKVVVRGFGTAPLSGNVNISAERVIGLDEGVGGEAIVGAGEARTFRFSLASDGEVGVGLQVDADSLECELLDEKQENVGDGCHQFHKLKKGTYYLRVQGPDEGPPRRFKPVVFGLKGSDVDVPDEWLRDFFARVQREASR
jgi:hypothetical protein